jgi:hypothetical protein
MSDQPSKPLLAPMRVMMEKCPKCNKPMTNRSTNRNRPDWVCKDSGCLNSRRHTGVKCTWKMQDGSLCGKDPAEIIDKGNMRYTKYKCLDGHEFLIAN